MGTVKKSSVNLREITEEQFEAAYVMWRSGADARALADELAISGAALSWCFLMRSADKLGEYTVHFKHPNSSTN